MLTSDKHPGPVCALLWEGLEGDGNGEADRGQVRATSAMTGQHQASGEGLVRLPEEVTVAWALV